jgi:hypothetical protein
VTPVRWEPAAAAGLGVGAPVLALALWVGHFFVGSLALSPADAARIYAAQNYGARSLLSAEVLAEEPLGGERVRVLCVAGLEVRLARLG